MRQPITVKYDPVSDTLYIDVCPPYKEQESDLIAAGVVARSNPQTGEIETLEVMHFQKRFEDGKPFEIPVSLDIRAARSA
jgi:uncharacterized protein YuzE